MVKRIECRIEGRVQLVMFRDFTKRTAQRFEIPGVVKNEGDGSVSVIAEGEEEKLEEFLKELGKGPVLAKVKKLDTHWDAPTGEFTDFKIIYY